MKDEAQRAAAIELHIEELVLHGFAPGDQHRIGDALGHEMERLISAHGLAGLDRSVCVSEVDGVTFRVAAGATARTLGEQLAQQVFRQMVPPAQAPQASVKP
jgi:hypothetical protein